MTWLEQNLDAYRIVSGILGDLRRAIREGLEAAYGESWYRDGLPKEVFDRLVAAKEREKSIDWYEGQYQQIMDYAVFADLIEILEQNTEHFPELMSLAPSSALLQARFVELDVMRAKLGRARPISETELSFLGTFHLRFKKAINEMPARDTVQVSDPPPDRPAEDADAPKPETIDPPPTEEPVEPPSVETETSKHPKPEAPKLRPPPPEPEKPQRPPARPQRVIERVAPPAGPGDGHRGEKDAEGADDAPRQAPRRAVQSSASSEPVEVGDSPDVESAVNPHAEEGVGGENVSPAETRAAVGPKKLAEALENSDNRTVLRELYREVTTIAESVWSSEVTPAPLVWEQVTASEWYKNSFSSLGLQPLSVFYEVTDNVEQMAREGATKKQLQEFLKDSNFAKTLLALRDMFQANNL